MGRLSSATPIEQGVARFAASVSPLQRGVAGVVALGPGLYLRWTATGYDWIRPGHYHAIVTGMRIHRLRRNIDLTAHTWRRNSNSVALACTCTWVGGRIRGCNTRTRSSRGCVRRRPGFLHGWGLTLTRSACNEVMTHAEAASNRDGRVMHDNYGPVIWEGTGDLRICCNWSGMDRQWR